MMEDNRPITVLGQGETLKLLQKPWKTGNGVWEYVSYKNQEEQITYLTYFIDEQQNKWLLLLLRMHEIISKPCLDFPYIHLTPGYNTEQLIEEFKRLIKQPDIQVLNFQKEDYKSYTDPWKSTETAQVYKISFSHQSLKDIALQEQEASKGEIILLRDEDPNLFEQMQQIETTRDCVATSRVFLYAFGKKLAL